MADHDPSTDAAGEPEPESFTGAPRWVKVLGALVLAVVVVLLVVKLMGGGAGHGPDRHLSGDPPAALAIGPSAGTGDSSG